ncbi:MAG TPA: aminotransferase class V-fold PLP-dependent enzyme [Chloroflexota bacterium]|nr:aminotransferase class V-fold PLP-dependent enzyme [Chloroflexota bacterium]
MAGATTTANPTSIYQSLGVRTFINAAGSYTRLGGSRMPAPVVEAMRAAAAGFVEIDVLQARVGERIAALTHNQAAYVTCGAAAGLFIATAACMTGPDQTRARQLPDPRGLPTRVVVQRAHRNPYDYAVRTLPVELVEVGFPNLIAPPAEWELAQALTQPTAAVLYVVGGWIPPGALSLEQVLALAHARGVPVIVDAAAQLPPRENLWRFTEMGADLVIFSGGKDLRGPQSSGIILGRPDLIAACALIGAPHHGIGRPLKVGKEELAGIAAAVDWYMEQDEEARARGAEDLVGRLIERLHRSTVAVERRFPNEAGQPIARALVCFKGIDGAARRDRVVHLLRTGDPSIEIGPGEEPDHFYVNPMTVEAGEEEILLDRLADALRDGE